VLRSISETTTRAAEMFEYRLHLARRPTHGIGSRFDGPRGIRQCSCDTILYLRIFDHALERLCEPAGDGGLVFDCALERATKFAQVVFDALAHG
jgi:hypothetical protein